MHLKTTESLSTEFPLRIDSSNIINDWRRTRESISLTRKDAAARKCLSKKQRTSENKTASLLWIEMDFSTKLNKHDCAKKIIKYSHLSSHYLMTQ